MSKAIAVFGAGSGLGVSVARRFGREGYRVALIARGQTALDAMVAQLHAEGVEAFALAADLSRPAQASALIDRINARFGHIDVLEYAPICPSPFLPAATLDAATLGSITDLLLLTPVELVNAVLPGMIERGEGAILMGGGGLALHPAPNFSGVPVAMAALRNYIHSLNAEVAGKGVYAGMLIVTAMIEGSGLAKAFAGEHGGKLPPGIPTVSPDALAEQYWQLASGRDRVETVYPQQG